MTRDPAVAAEGVIEVLTAFGEILLGSGDRTGDDDVTRLDRDFRIAGMIYLSDVETHGGGTIVWRGSHTIIAEVAKSDPIRFAKMAPLNEHLPNVDLGDPLELTPRAGDALFYKCLCAHTGSMNTTNRPRLALNMKW